MLDRELAGQLHLPVVGEELADPLLYDGDDRLLLLKVVLERGERDAQP